MGLTDPPTNPVLDNYARAMKAPRIGEAATRLADQARDAGWSHEEYLAAVLSHEVSPPGKPPAQSYVSGRPGSRAANRWKSSPSTTNPGSNETPSPTWAPEYF
jgi:hypothetical protein